MTSKNWIEHDGLGRPLPVGTVVDVRHFNGDVTSDFTVGGGQTFAPDGSNIAPSRARWSGWDFFDGGPVGPKFRAYRIKSDCDQQEHHAATVQKLLANLVEA